MKRSIRRVVPVSCLGLILLCLALVACRSESPTADETEESSWLVTLSVGESSGGSLTVVTESCGCSTSTFDVYVDGTLKREMDCSDDAVLDLSQGSHEIEIRTLAGANSVAYSLSTGWHLRVSCSS